MTAIGPIVRTGMTAIGYMMMRTTWMSMDTSRRNEKEKERKERKASMMKAKEESQEMEKANQTMFNLRSHQLLLNNNNNNDDDNNNNVVHHCRKFIREQDILSFTDFTADADLCTDPTAHSSLFCCLAIV